jgi:AP-4 complex subunit epsilon-1
LLPFVATVQDVSLLSMLRVAAGCDEVPSDVLSIVAEVGKTAGRHIRRVNILPIGSFKHSLIKFQRCDQFTALCKEKDVLADLVRKAKSPSVTNPIPSEFQNLFTEP